MNNQSPCDFWDTLAAHHSTIENNYFDLPSLRRIVHDLQEPVLVVGAGQGLIVEELQRQKLRTDGIDLSSEMIRYAKKRRGLNLIQADARALPFGDKSYETIIYATGVVDFIDDDAQIRVILNEARRVITPAGRIFVAFHRLSPPLEKLLAKLGLLRNNAMALREVLGMHRMTPIQTITWAAKRANLDYLRATTMVLRSWVLSTVGEKAAALSMQKIFRNSAHADALIAAAPETQPYRNEHEIRLLFTRLAIPIRRLEASGSCLIAQI